MGYFSDIGLAAALIQKKEKPTLKEIRSTFTLQQILVIFTILILLLLTPLIKTFYGFSDDGKILLYVFAFSFFLSSLKTIPSILLERKLEFTKIIIPQLVETLLFNIIVIFFAWQGLGIKSYIWAILARSLGGVITLYAIAPWEIGISFSFSELKRLLKFGVPYQLNTLLAVVKDKFMILLLGKLVGNEGIAILGWAEKWATMPLRYFLDNTQKVAFPTFARLQHDKAKLIKAIEKTTYFLAVLILPALTGIAVLGYPLVHSIPKYLKWEPGLVPLYLYCFASLWGSFAVIITTIFNSIGQIKTTLKLMIIWTMLSWVFTPILTWRFGILGAAIAVVIINFSSIIGFFILKKYLSVNIEKQIKGPIFASLIMLIFILIARHWLPNNLWGIISMILVGIIIYGLSFIIIDGNKLKEESASLMAIIKTKL